VKKSKHEDNTYSGFTVQKGHIWNLTMHDS